MEVTESLWQAVADFVVGVGEGGRGLVALNFYLYCLHCILGKYSECKYVGVELDTHDLNLLTLVNDYVNHNSET